MSLAGVHDAGVVTMLHVVEQDLLEPDHGIMGEWRYENRGMGMELVLTHSPAFS